MISIGNGARGAAVGPKDASLLSAGGGNRGPAEIVEIGADGSESVIPQQGDAGLAKLSVSLSFVDTDIKEVSRVLFSELLRRPYSVDAAVSGQVTLRSGGQVDGNAALTLARQAFEAAGGTIVLSDGVFRVTTLSNRSMEPSSNSRSFRLKHIDSSAAQGALQPLIQGRAEILVANGGGLTVRGDAETLALVGAMLDAIDVDRFKTSSFGLFPLQSGTASVVIGEMKGLFNAVGVTGETMIPIERMNAILLIADKASHVEFARKWLKRLDQGATNERQVFVYKVQNRDADDLADLVRDIFANAGLSTEGPSAASTPNDFAMSPSQSMTVAVPSVAVPGDGIKITADGGSNTLIVWATSAEYQLIERALQRLDQPLSQVFVEATIAEVRLNNELSHGVRWFLQAGPFSAGISDNSSGAVAPNYPGFNFSFKVPEAQVVISALEAHTDVRIVSSPQLTVIDRETATIQVGDQVPIVTKSVQDASSGRNVIANDVTFRDTGVILKVTPQIRSSGEVVLEIEQEVSRVVPTTSSQINSPTISQRKVSSTVAVPDGTAVVLGGLMSSSEEAGGGGLPGTQKTVLESIFGSKKVANARSELIIIIRPVIINNSGDMRQIVNEIASKMSNVLSVEVN